MGRDWYQVPMIVISIYMTSPLDWSESDSSVTCILYMYIYTIVNVWDSMVMYIQCQ